jgi:dynein assembly factor 5, axonemal
MELLPKYLNELQDPNKMKRCAAYKKTHELVSSHKDELTEDEAFTIIRACLKGFEDSSERAREEAVRITTELLPGQTASILDWVLPSVVTRIGIMPVAEESEEIRLLLLRLGTACMTCFPHDIGPRNYIDFFQVLLENCFRDPFPDLKKEACKAASQLCEIEPKQVKVITVPLAKAVKNACLMHKHSAVRAEAANTLSVLFRCGAAEVLKDKDELDNRTTASELFVLCNDHSEPVRLGVLGILSCALLDIKERVEMHAKYLPHLLLLVTDPFDAVRARARETLDRLGQLYMMDNEDNRIDLASRRVTMKDIEWYGDDEYPCMTALTSPAAPKYDLFNTRPSLGARYVVADAVRGFLDRVLADVTAVDWVIPFSTNNRKVIALKLLWTTIYFCEKSSVQFTERVLSAVYKAFADELPTVKEEAALCIEVLGKFLVPDQYLPFLIAKPQAVAAVTAPPAAVADDAYEDTTIVQKSRNKTVILTSVDEVTGPNPTLFSTAAVTVKCSILQTLSFLIEGSKDKLTGAHATRIMQALTANELIECENEPLLLALLTTMQSIFAVFVEKNFMASPEQPLPQSILEDPKQRTLDSIALYALLRIKSTEMPSVQLKARGAIAALSTLVTGSITGIYTLHVERLLTRYGAALPVSAFSDLVLNAENVSALGGVLANIFVSRLAELNFAVKVTEELRYFTVLERLLWGKTMTFSPSEAHELLRGIVLPLATFQPGNTAHLFRKVAVNCLCAMVDPAYREALRSQLEGNGCALSTKLINAWCSASDADDGEMRLVCMSVLHDVCALPMMKGSAHEIVQSVLLRFDDSNELVRLRTSSKLLTTLENSSFPAEGTSFFVLDEITSQMVPLAKKILIYLDDTEETVGIRTVLTAVLKKLGDISPNIVVDLTRSALERHEEKQYCEDVLQYLEPKY